MLQLRGRAGLLAAQDPADVDRFNAAGGCALLEQTLEADDRLATPGRVDGPGSPVPCLWQGLQRAGGPAAEDRAGAEDGLYGRLRRRCTKVEGGPQGAGSADSAHHHAAAEARGEGLHAALGHQYLESVSDPCRLQQRLGGLPQTQRNEAGAGQRQFSAEISSPSAGTYYEYWGWERPDCAVDAPWCCWAEQASGRQPTRCRRRAGPPDHGVSIG